MPCYSKIETVLIDLKAIEQAAKETGITVERIGNRIRLSKGLEHLSLERTQENDRFHVVPYSGSDNWPTEITDPLSSAYAKTMIKTWAQKNNYQFSAGKGQGEYVLTQYTTK